jgi:fluoroquinolone resistance protein
VIEAARAGPVEPGVGDFGLVRGRVDLRGFPFHELQVKERRRPGLQARGLVFRAVDLTEALFGGVVLDGCLFEDCVFDRASMRSLDDHGNRFVRCSFDRTDLFDAAVGYDGSRYEDCTFDRARFRRAIFNRPEFDRCVFARCRLDGADFNGASFVECRFTGRLVGVWFRGGFEHRSHARTFGKPRPNEMLRVDFFEAELRGVHFSDGCDLSTAVVGPRHILLDDWPNRLRAAMRELGGTADPTRTELQGFLRSYIRSNDDQQHYILNVDELREELGEEGAQAVVDALTRTA